jgi:hypothetical protein
MNMLGPVHAKEVPQDRRIDHLYILIFDRGGVLPNPAELDFTMQALSDDPTVDRILILSYGWNQDGCASYSAYRTLVDDLRANAGPNNLVLGGYRRGVELLANSDPPAPGHHPSITRCYRSHCLAARPLEAARIQDAQHDQQLAQSLQDGRGYLSLSAGAG